MLISRLIASDEGASVDPFAVGGAITVRDLEALPTSLVQAKMIKVTKQRIADRIARLFVALSCVVGLLHIEERILDRWPIAYGIPMFVVVVVALVWAGGRTGIFGRP
jgi:hypothetical protein